MNFLSNLGTLFTDRVQNINLRGSINRLGRAEPAGDSGQVAGASQAGAGQTENLDFQMKGSRFWKRLGP